MNQHFNPYLINGGYPYMGYPPNLSNNGFQPINPGINTPIEISSGNSSVIIPPMAPNYGISGGINYSSGGFNPYTGMITQPTLQQGFGGYNPYQSFIGNPGYQTGFSPFSPPFQRPNYGLGIPLYGQDAFNNQYLMEDIVYSDNGSGFDVRKELEAMILTDEERAKINLNNQFNGYDYYGRPIYNNALLESQRRQREFEEARELYIDYFTTLSRVTHKYDNSEFDEDEARNKFDPVRRQQQMNPTPALYNKTIYDYQNATPEEKEKYEKEMRFRQAQEVVKFVEYYNSMQPYIMNQRSMLFRQIKESHDRMIGVNPGESYDLKTYMDNGYRICISNALTASRKTNRNVSNRYSQNAFRADLSMRTNSAVPITSKDDEYVSIESMLKGIFDKNKAVDSIFRSQNGQTSILSVPATPSEHDSHMMFLQKMEESRKMNDMKMEIRGTAIL